MTDRNQLIAKIVKKVVGSDVNIINEHSNDDRSYHISSLKSELPPKNSSFFFWIFMDFT